VFSELAVEVRNMYGNLFEECKEKIPASGLLLNQKLVKDDVTKTFTPFKM
jgi:hypothetical protein